jgi:hypothetical protein
LELYRRNDRFGPLVKLESNALGYRFSGRDQMASLFELSDIPVSPFCSTDLLETTPALCRVGVNVKFSPFRP